MHLFNDRDWGIFAQGATGSAASVLSFSRS
jgi:hypothetical protein